MIKYRIGLTKEEVDELSAILRKGSHSTLRYRVAHILLNCDEGEHGDKVPDRSIGKVLRVSTRTIERTKRRFMEESFPYQSGSSIKGKAKTHYPRNRSLKAMLTKGAITAIQHDPQPKAYYNRKKKEGKHHMSVINAVANKLVLRIFAVAKREEPFVKLAA